MTALAPEGAGTAVRTPPRRVPISRDAVWGLTLAAGLGAVAFAAGGGFAEPVPAGDTWTEIVVTLLGVGACAAAVWLAAPARAWGGATAGLFAAVALLTVVSISWSVQPEYSWQAAGQTLAYLAVFAGAAALARLAPRRWPALLGALATASAAVAGYALLVKVFPATLDAGNPFGRLQAPFGYWNAAGVGAAIGLPACLWAGARKAGGRALRTIAAPALALLISVVALSLSRSATLAAVIAVAAWFAFVPLRLRAVVTLAAGAVGAVVIIGWALSTAALTDDGVALAVRTSAGHSFGIVVVLALAASTAAGAAGVYAVDRGRLSAEARRRIGSLLLAPLALVPIALVVALAVSSRGLTGEVSHIWSTLTSTSSSVGNNAGRLVALGNSRPLYWSEGITVGEHALLKGVGAAGYATAHTRYTTSTLAVRHAHSYVIQTFADLGVIGLVLNLALLVAWGRATARPLAGRTCWRMLSDTEVAEREGMVTLAAAVLAFGVQSAIDWTWFFAGVAIPALVCAGWLAGRGPLARPVGPRRQLAGDAGAAVRRPVLERPGAAALVTGLVTLGLLGAWTTWQPLRSSDALATSLNAAAQGDRSAAFTHARDAADIDPEAIEPLSILASLYAGAGDVGAARGELLAAVRRQPQNPAPWQWLGAFDLQHHQPRRALGPLLRALALDPTDATTITLVGQARSAPAAPPPPPKS